MKTTMIKIGLIIGVLLFLCSTTSWAEGRKNNHHYNKHDYKAKTSKSNHNRYGRTPHHNGHNQRHYYAKRPGHSAGRHPSRHRHHHYYRLAPKYYHHYRPAPRYHHRQHYDYSYPYRHGFWFFWRSH